VTTVIVVVLLVLAALVGWVRLCVWYESSERRAREGEQKMKQAERAREAQQAAEDRAKHPFEYEVIARLRLIAPEQWHYEDAGDSFTTASKGGARVRLKGIGVTHFDYAESIGGSYRLFVDGKLIISFNHDSLPGHKAGFLSSTCAQRELGSLYRVLDDYRRAQEEPHRREMARAKEEREKAAQQALQQEQAEKQRQRRDLLDKL
jgi:hypothetical protein